jgi:hypothetical protein
MASRKRLEVLCEDTAHRDFVLALCRRLGWIPPRLSVAPKGAGDAKQWIRARYGAFVRTFRARMNAQAHLVALVVIDGDDEGVVARKRQLDETLRSSDPPLSTRSPTERLAILVPTWSIETWLMFLCGYVDVGETESKKHAAKPLLERQVISARQAVETWLGEPPASPRVPSLEDARAEVRSRFDI